jgi:hypothetical protein
MVVANMKHVSLGNMMHSHARPPEPPTNDEYIRLYGPPLRFLHGDPEGMPGMMPLHADEQTHCSIRLDDAFLNALMVDAGRNTLVFCAIFLDMFKPRDASFARTTAKLNTVFRALPLKHPYRMPDGGLRVLNEELAAGMRAEQPPEMD